jgi:hypothetical protein
MLAMAPPSGPNGGWTALADHHEHHDRMHVTDDGLYRAGRHDVHD